MHDDLLVVEPQSPPARNLQLALVELLQVARTRLGVFLGSSIGLFLAVTISALVTPPLFTGTARVMVDMRQNNTLSTQNVQQVLSGLPTDQASILDQVQILKSRQLAGRVVDRLRLDLDPEFAASLVHHTSLLGYLNPLHYLRPSVIDRLSPDERKELLRDKTIDRFENDLSVAQVQLSTAIEINFQCLDPAKAARIANAIADAYVEDQLNAKLEATQRATQWISSRLGKLAQDARIAEAALENYKTSHHLTDVASGSGSISVLDQQIAAATAQLMQAKVDRAQSEATLSRVRSLVNSGHAADVSQVVSSPLITQLRQQQAELVQKQALMASRYGPQHPKMLDLIAEQRDLQTKIEEEIQHVVGTAANDVAVASSRAGALESNLRQLEGQSSVQGQARVEQRELEANASSSRAIYDSFVSRIKQTEQEQTLQIPDARIISRSPTPTAQSFPPLFLIFVGSIPASIFFGFLVVVMLERLDHGFRTVARVEEVLGLPVLATLPDTVGRRLIGASRAHEEVVAADEMVERPLGTFAESVRGLQMGLTLSNVDCAPKVVLVTSAVPSEGKTTTALSLARHVAQSGQKVILVDGDLRRPGIREMTGIGPSERDLVDVLQGACPLESAIVGEPRSPLALLPAAKSVSNAPDLVESQAMRRLVKQLSETYDLVVIDSAPILPVNDTRILSRLADAVLFVIRWENTPRNAALDAVKSLRSVHAPLAGVVLSLADTKRFHYYSFGYAGYHYSSAYTKYYEN
jgi:capsular exopolysaccharide synthesis family protein